jgi:hypothetical protein
MTTAREDGSTWIVGLIPATILPAPFLSVVLGRLGRQTPVPPAIGAAPPVQT